MELQSYISRVQAQLAAAAALGDDRTRATAEALATAAEPAIRLAVLAAVTAAADELTAALLDSPGSPAVSVRLDGDDLLVGVRSTGAAPAGPVGPAEEADATARISLRLSEALKSDIDTAARSDGISVNAWLVRAAARALHGSTAQAGSHSGGAGTWEARGSGRGNARNPHHITGWINS